MTIGKSYLRAVFEQAEVNYVPDIRLLLLSPFPLQIFAGKAALPLGR